MTKEELQQAFDKANEEMIRSESYTKAIDHLADNIKEGDTTYNIMVKMTSNALKEAIRVNQEVLYKVLSNLCDDKD